MKKLISFFVLGSLVTSVALAKRYKYTIDPEHAEEILARVGGRQRMFQADWAKQLGDLKEQTYRIRKGDSMWSISKRMLGDPFLWRKLWQENADFLNPHEIEVGRLLTYYHAGRGLASMEIPVIKLRPGNAATDLEEDSLASSRFKDRYPLSFVVLRGDEFIGEISGAYVEKENLSVQDEIYLTLFDKKLAQSGDKYLVVREERRLKESGEGAIPMEGSLVRIIGEVRVQWIGAQLVRAEILNHQAGIVRGDKLIPLLKMEKFEGGTYGPNELQAQIAMGEEPSTSLFRQGQLVVLNKGSVSGMKLGYLFKVFRDTDPKEKSTTGVEPDSKGEIQVVQVSENASVGYILRNKEPLEVGDQLFAYQTLPDPPKPPKRELETIGID